MGDVVRREGVEYVEAPAYQRRRRRRSVGDHRKSNAIDQRPLAAADPVGRAGQRPVSIETRQVDILLVPPLPPAEAAGPAGIAPVAVGIDRIAVGDACAAPVEPRQFAQAQRPPLFDAAPSPLPPLPPLRPHPP